MLDWIRRPNDHLTARQAGSVTESVWVTIACALLIVVGKCWYVHRTASPFPFWDQWDGEVLVLMRHYLDGSLVWTDFLTPANEHRIVYTRILNLGAFVLQGERMNCLLPIYVQALIHSASGVLLLRELNRERPHWFLSLALALPFAWPVSSENMFWSYQSQVYIQILSFTLATIWLAKPDYSLRRMLLLAAFVWLNMATTLLLPVLGICASYLHFTATRDQRHLRNLALYATLAGAIYLTIPFNPAHAAMKAASFGAFLTELKLYLERPLGAGWLMWTPFAWSSWQILVRKNRSPLLITPWLLHTLVLCLSALASYGRQGGVPDRYNDYIALAYAASVLTVCQATSMRSDSISLRAMTQKLALLVGVGLVAYAGYARIDGDRKIWVRRYANGTKAVAAVYAAFPLSAEAAQAQLKQSGQNVYPSDEALAQLLVHPASAYMFRNWIPPESRVAVSRPAPR
ncbi:hypothetical protein [Aquabacterium sp.]|uniref:hypothetical protein n=1 Tax=Aquabacterium sp. TaxID=1872578 RepID=UPI0035B473BD